MSADGAGDGARDEEADDESDGAGDPKSDGKGDKTVESENPEVGLWILGFSSTGESGLFRFSGLLLLALWPVDNIMPGVWG